jgi:hypothetical protein
MPVHGPPPIMPALYRLHNETAFNTKVPLPLDRIDAAFDKERTDEPFIAKSRS